MRAADVALTALVLSLSGCGVLGRKDPPNISETKARLVADKEFEAFCRQEEEACSDFEFTGMWQADHQKFWWSFHYENKNTDPMREITVSVTLKGETATRFTTKAMEANL